MADGLFHVLFAIKSIEFYNYLILFTLIYENLL